MRAEMDPRVPGAGSQCGITVSRQIACVNTGKLVPTNHSFVQVIDSASVTCALDIDGKVACEPPLYAQTQEAFEYISLQTESMGAGLQPLCGVTPTGGLKCWTDGVGPAFNYYSSFSNVTNVVQASAYNDSVCMLDADGEIYCAFHDAVNTTTIPLADPDFASYEYVYLSSARVCMVTWMNELYCMDIDDPTLNLTHIASNISQFNFINNTIHILTLNNSVIDEQMNVLFGENITTIGIEGCVIDNTGTLYSFANVSAGIADFDPSPLWETITVDSLDGVDGTNCSKSGYGNCKTLDYVFSSGLPRINLNIHVTDNAIQMITTNLSINYVNIWIMAPDYIAVNSELHCPSAGGTQYHPCIFIYAEGFMLINIDLYGGIYFQTYTLMIQDSNFYNCSTNAIVIQNAALVYIEYTSFQHNGMNGTDRDGSAIMATDTAVLLFNCTFLHNWGRNGGSIYMQSNETNILHILSGYFEDSMAMGNGGSIYGSGLDVTLEMTEFYNGGAMAGGAVYLDNSVLSFIATSVCASNMAQDGGCIYVGNSTTKQSAITDSMFSANQAMNQGGAIYFAGMSLDLQRNQFSDQAANMGGDLYLFHTDLTYDANSHSQSSSTAHGGSIYLDNSNTMNMTHHASIMNFNFDTPVSNNGNGGAIYASANTQLDLNGGQIFNGGGVMGGAIYAQDSVVSLSQTEIDSSSATISGGAVYIKNTDNATYFTNTLNVFASSFFASSSDPGSGGAIYLENVLAYISNASFVFGVATYGGGIAIINSQVMMNTSFFQGNGASQHGGAIYLYTNQTDFGGLLMLDTSDLQVSEADGNGGAIYANNGALLVTNTQFRNNEGAYGGSIYILNGKLYCDTNTFHSGDATNDGGAIYINNANQSQIITATDVQIISSSFTSVDATNGNGGALYVDTSSDVNMYGVTFTQNSAKMNGGGMYFKNIALLGITNGYIHGNLATGNGAGIYLDGKLSENYTSTFFMNATLDQNVAQGLGGGMWQFWTELNQTSGQMQDITFSRNTAKVGGGLYTNQVWDATKINVSTNGNQITVGYGPNYASPPSYLTTSTLQVSTIPGALFNTTITANAVDLFNQTVVPIYPQEQIVAASLSNASTARGASLKGAMNQSLGSTGYAQFNNLSLFGIPDQRAYDLLMTYSYSSMGNGMVDTTTFVNISTMLNNCPPGTPLNNATGSCAACAPGRSQPNNTQTCEPCGAGLYQNMSGQASCSSCPPGQFMNETGAVECFMCGVGYYNNNNASLECTTCPAGTSSDEGSNAQNKCTLCPVATYSEGGGPCLECSSGKTTGLTNCDSSDSNVGLIVGVTFAAVFVAAIICFGLYKLKQRQSGTNQATPLLETRPN